MAFRLGELYITNGNHSFELPWVWFCCNWICPLHGPWNVSLWNYYKSYWSFGGIWLLKKFGSCTYLMCISALCTWGAVDQSKDFYRKGMTIAALLASCLSIQTLWNGMVSDMVSWVSMLSWTKNSWHWMCNPELFKTQTGDKLNV